jgi:hypothetical protein
MDKPFLMKLSEIRPSQLYINSSKISAIKKQYSSLLKSVPPVPIKKLGGKIFYTDGHTRALAVFLKGLKEISVVWEDEELDWELYEVCLKWCEEEGINTIGDLQNRIIDNVNYQILWLDRCKRLEKQMELRRKNKNENCT